MTEIIFTFTVFFLCALLDWYAVASTNKKLEYIFKPATMCALIIATLALKPAVLSQTYGRFYLLGFVFSLVGDVFLMLPQARTFLYGLFAFLFAHVAYIFALNQLPPPIVGLWLVVPIAVIGIWFISRVIEGLHRKQQAFLVKPVIGYGLTILLMLFSAWVTLLRPEWNRKQSALVFIGGTLFCISDALLAWNRFIKAFPGANLLVIITYHLGQFAFALGIIL